MANIDIQNISDLDLNGNSLFDDSESFITELDDNGESIVGGGGFKFNPQCVISAVNCGKNSVIIPKPAPVHPPAHY